MPVQKKYYKGKFIPRNQDKYIGTLPIIYRSLWELAIMNHFDNSNDVVKWGSESIVVPYLYECDNRVHRYFIDFNYVDRNNRKYLIEVKPKKQTLAPKPPKRNSIKSNHKYMIEQMEYQKNCDKWKAAHEFAQKYGMVFKIWTEETLQNLGLMARK